MYCFGVSNHSPMQVVDFLVKAKAIAAQKEVQVVEFGMLLPETKPKKSVLFLVNIQDFYRNCKTLNTKAYENTQVFVFASALRIRELQSCTAMDCEPTQESPGVVVRLNNLSRQVYRAGLKESRFDVKRQDRKYLTAMIDSVKQGSLLNPLMTFIYTLPSSTHQTPVKEACASFFYDGLSFNDLQKHLAKKYHVDLTDRMVEKLRNILEGEVGQAYTKFFKEYRSKKKDAKNINLDSMCKVFSTSAYEVRYIVSVVGERDDRGSSRRKSISTLSDEEETARKQKKLKKAK